MTPDESVLRNDSGSPARPSHPESIATNAPSGMRPWRRSQAWRSSTERSVFGSAAARPAMRMIASGATRWSTGILSIVVPPEAKWAGASTCVPVCSSIVRTPSNQPSVSTLAIISNFIGGTPGKSGKSGVSRCVRSMTPRTPDGAILASRWVRGDCGEVRDVVSPDD